MTIIHCFMWRKEINMANVGEQIKSARERKKLSLRELEILTGISNPYLSQLENGKVVKPSPNFLWKLSFHLDLDFKQLMMDAGFITPLTIDENKHRSILFEDGLTDEEEVIIRNVLSYIRVAKNK